MRQTTDLKCKITGVMGKHRWRSEVTRLVSPKLDAVFAGCPSQRRVAPQQSPKWLASLEPSPDPAESRCPITSKEDGGTSIKPIDGLPPNVVVEFACQRTTHHGGHSRVPAVQTSIGKEVASSPEYAHCLVQQSSRSSENENSTPAPLNVRVFCTYSVRNLIEVTDHLLSKTATQHFTT